MAHNISCTHANEGKLSLSFLWRDTHTHTHRGRYYGDELQQFFVKPILFGGGLASLDKVFPLIIHT